MKLQVTPARDVVSTPGRGSHWVARNLLRRAQLPRRAVERPTMSTPIVRARGARRALSALTLSTLVALVLGCGAPPARAPRAPNVAALEAALAAEGYGVYIRAREDGRVEGVNFLQAAPTTKLPREIFLAVMKAHGDLLGYGPLGEALFEGPAGTTGAIVGRFPNAQGCPNLHYLAAFEVSDATTKTPWMWAFGCDTSERSMEYFSSFQRMQQALDEGRKPRAPAVTDPFATWVRSEGIPTDNVQRTADGVRASSFRAPPLVGDRLALVRAFAERAAKFEGLPELDTVELTRGKSPNHPALLPTTFGTLTLRLAKPALDGACIDPRVVVDLFDDDGRAPSTRIVGVAVECAREPVTGTMAPADAGRMLPRAAVGSLPFIAICQSLDAAWGYRHSGYVIDRRGDVYTFWGGRPFEGNSAHELAVLLRHGKQYKGTLLPGEVDRLVSLASQVEREPFQKHAVQIQDAPGGGCQLFRSGATADALVPIPFDAFGTTVGKRAGPASSEVERVLKRAESLAARR